LIVIDAPAVSEGEDAALLAEFADAVVPLVDGSRYADASAEARALQLAIDLPSLGVVINAVPSAGAARPVAAGGERLGTGPTDSLDEEPDDEAVPIFTEAESAGVGGTADAGPDERGSN
jgi:Mrp family chromosome partitioning ATPase